MIMNSYFYCVAFMKLKKTHQETSERWTNLFPRKKLNERTHVTTVRIGLNGIGLSKTNHIVHYI